MKRIYTLLLLIGLVANSFAQEYIQMKKEVSGTYTIPCEVNGLRLRFILDTGASAVSLSSVEANFMYKNGYITDTDIKGTINSKLADGSISENTLVLLKKVKIGSIVLNNIEAIVSDNIDAPLLLGQSVLSKVGTWTIKGDNFILNDVTSDGGVNWPDLKAKADNILSQNGGMFPDYESIRNLIRPAMKAGIKDAIIMYAEGLGNDSDPEEILCIQKLKDLSEKNDVDASYSLGMYYERKDDLANSIKYRLRTKGSDKYGMVCHDLAFMYYNKNDEINYIKWIKEAISAGTNDVDLLIEYYQKHNQMQVAINLLNSEISKGNISLKYDLGNIYLEGKGVKKNIVKAVQLLEGSHKPDAYVKLAKMYLWGIDVIKNNSKAKHFLDLINYNDKWHIFDKLVLSGLICDEEKNYKGAREYFEDALNRLASSSFIASYEDLEGIAYLKLGEYYEYGKGVLNKNAETAFNYYNKAIEKGNVQAYGFLGDLFLDDNLVEVDISRAIDVYKQGAENNDAYCCYKLGLCYKEGYGVPVNRQLSEEYLNKAKKLGYIE